MDDSTIRNQKSEEKIVVITCIIRNTIIDNIYMLQHSTCQRFEVDCKDLIWIIQDPRTCLNFSTKLKELAIWKQES